MIEVDEVKSALRISDDNDDSYIGFLIKAAIKLYERRTNRLLVRPLELPEDNPKAVELDESIKQGVILVVGHWYENREASTSLTLSDIPLGVSACWESDRFFHI